MGTTPKWGFGSFRLVWLVAVAATLSACASISPSNYQQLEAAYAQPYKLDSGDTVRITVFGQRELTRLYSVDDGGNVSMPLIGSVRARGTTTKTLAHRIKTKLAADYLRKPDVSVEIQTYRPFFVLGEVQRAGQFAYVSGMTVENAVAIAGGFTYRADQRQVKITRRAKHDAIEGLAPLNAPIRPGDTVFVLERTF